MLDLLCSCVLPASDDVDNASLEGIWPSMQRLAKLYHAPPPSQVGGHMHTPHTIRSALSVRPISQKHRSFSHPDCLTPPCLCTSLLRPRCLFVHLTSSVRPFCPPWQVVAPTITIISYHGPPLLPHFDASPHTAFAQTPSPLSSCTDTASSSSAQTLPAAPYTDTAATYVQPILVASYNHTAPPYGHPPAPVPPYTDPEVALWQEACPPSLSDGSGVDISDAWPPDADPVGHHNTCHVHDITIF